MYIHISIWKYHGGWKVWRVPIPSEGDGAPAGSHLPHRPSHTYTSTTLPSSSFLAKSLHPSKLHLIHLPRVEAGTQWALAEQLLSRGGARGLDARRVRSTLGCAAWKRMAKARAQIGLTAQRRCGERSPGPSVESLCPPQHAAAVMKCPFIQVSTKLNPNWSLPDDLLRGGRSEWARLCNSILRDYKWSHLSTREPLAKLSAVTHLGSS